MNKISDKTTDMENKMGQFDLLKDQLKSIQNDLAQVSKDLSLSIDKSKGTSTEGVYNINPEVKSPDNTIQTDE